MEISQNRKNEVLVVALSGRFDAQSAQTVEKSLDASIQAGDTKLLIDMTGVEYISSAGLRVLLATAKKIGAQKGKLVLAALKPYVREVFEVAGFTAIFQISPDTDSALSSF